MAQLLPGYELTLILRSEMNEEGVTRIREKIGEIVRGFDGEVIHAEDWGKKRLAYPIKKETRGRYIYTVFNGKSGVVAEVERNLRLNEGVFRFLTVQLESEFDGPAFKKKALGNAPGEEQQPTA